MTREELGDGVQRGQAAITPWPIIMFIILTALAFWAMLHVAGVIG